jgi:hypothetical protein
MVISLDRYRKLNYLFDLRDRSVGRRDAVLYLAEMRAARKEMGITVKEVRSHYSMKVNKLIDKLPEYLKEIPF